MDSTTNSERIDAELSDLAAKFADIYVTDGLKAGRAALLEILRVATRFEQRMVIEYFRKAMRARGVRALDGLIH